MIAVEDRDVREKDQKGQVSLKKGWYFLAAVELTLVGSSGHGARPDMDVKLTYEDGPEPRDIKQVVNADERFCRQLRSARRATAASGREWYTVAEPAEAALSNSVARAAGDAGGRCREAGEAVARSRRWGCAPALQKLDITLLRAARCSKSAAARPV